MEENKRNNILDNLEENEKGLYEILGIISEVKARITGTYGWASKVKECETKSELNTVSGKVGKQTGIIADIREDIQTILNSI